MSNGQGCTCNAWSENECACGADWTPQEVYDLRAENNRLKAELAEAKKDVEILHWLFGYTPAMLYVLFDANDEKELRAAIDEAMKGK